MPPVNFPCFTTAAREQTEKILSDVSADLFHNCNAVRIIEDLIDDEISEEDTVMQLANNLDGLVDSYGTALDLGQKIWEVLSNVEASIELTAGQHFERVIVTFTEAGTTQYTYPIFIEVGKAPLTTPQIEGILVEHFSASTRLDSPGDFGESYWTNSENALSFTLTGKRYLKDSEIITDMDGMNIFQAS